jgi:hypothetical protein
MNIQTVKTNLEKTIAGKEELLKEWEHSDFVQLRSVAKYVKVNIDELRRILQDVEQCIGIEE